ncbi:serine hydrolase domain-containing protein [Lewinella sp. LCG006]|uniref:serine hydrolase domain-containing protein n=1 Tax=Lewinella sp. LCG006 TaxID=3231911 RepID=UPI0034601A29
MSIINKLLPTGIICSLIFCLQIQAQSIDSIMVNGLVKWSNDSIIHFPDKVIIKSKYDPAFIKFVKVDSTGNYKLLLPVGDYVATPYSNYHWHRDWDQGFIRINETSSKVFFNIDPTVSQNHHTLVLDTLILQSTIPKEGVIFNLDSTSISMLDEFILHNLDYYQVPGASLAIIKNGQVVYSKAYGVVNPITEEAVNESTIFEFGSITKPVFSFVVLRLVEKGVIDLDKPLYKYLPFPDVEHDSRYRLITARHVLNHQTGFPNWAERNEKGEFDLLFTPGMQFGYSGEGFEYLKRVLVHLTNKDIETILEEELIQPLGLNNFYFKTNDYVRNNIADGFYRGTPSRSGFKEPNMAASLMTNPVDFAKFAIAVRNKVGLSPKTYDDIFRKHTVINESLSRGMGFELRKDNIGESYGHTGITRDFVSFYRYYPESDVGFIFTANNITGGWLTLVTLKEFLITGKN